MVNRQTHIVRRQVLELGVPSEREAHPLQERMRQIYYERALPLLDRLFSELTDSGEVIRLNRLELDLGTLPAGQIEERFLSVLQREVEAEIGAHRAERGLSVEGEEVRRRTSLRRERLETFLVFLASGRTPWWTANPAGYDPEEELDFLLGDQPEALTAGLRAIDPMIASPRLARQFSERALVNLLEHLAPGSSASLMAVLRELTALQAEVPTLGRSFAKRSSVVWATAFSGALSQLHRIPEPSAVAEAVLEEFVTTVTRNTGRARGEVMKLMNEAVNPDFKEASLVARWLERQEVRTGGPAGETEEVDERMEMEEGRSPRFEEANESEARARAPAGDGSRDGGARKGDRGRSSAPNRQAPADEPQTHNRNRQRPESERSTDGSGRNGPGIESASVRGDTSDRGEIPEAHLREPIESGAAAGSEVFGDASDYYIDNAGLVLLWPFLGHFFEALELTAGGAFVTERAHERAVLLTQYLVTGDTDVSEHRIVLNKILCGWSLGESLGRSFRPAGREIAECEDLLTSAITHWEALKSTSVDGFRHSFLQRDGRLVEEDTHWSLTVDRTGYDVLLDRLPWGIGLITRQWMDKPISVEW